MDVYRLFYEYHFQNKRPTSKKTKTSSANIVQLLSLMQNEHDANQKKSRPTQNRKKNRGKDILSKRKSFSAQTVADFESTETDTELDPYSLSDDDVPTASISSPGTVGTVLPTLPSPGPNEMKFACDTIFTQFHAKRIQSLAKGLNSTVTMKWVRVVASNVQPPTHVNDGFKMLHKHDKGNENQLQNRHVHIYGNVKEFVKCYATASTQNVITFSLYNSEEAIHIQSLKEQLEQRTSNSSDESDSLLLLMCSCSIGLPTRQMYTPCQFMAKWTSSRYKVVNNGHLVCTILKGKVGLDRQIDGVQSAQLIHAYNDSSLSFVVSENNKSTPLSYFVTQWYSYPDESDLRGMLTHLKKIKKYCCE